MATQYRIERDAENQRLVIRQIDDTDSSDKAETPKVSIALPDAIARFPAEGTGVSLQIKLRAIRDCKDGDAGYRIVLCSEFIAGDPPDDFLDD